MTKSGKMKSSIYFMYEYIILLIVIHEDLHIRLWVWGGWSMGRQVKNSIIKQRLKYMEWLEEKKNKRKGGL